MRGEMTAGDIMSKFERIRLVLMEEDIPLEDVAITLTYLERMALRDFFTTYGAWPTYSTAVPTEGRLLGIRFVAAEGKA